MAKFRKKPVVIEAIQLQQNTDSQKECLEFSSGRRGPDGGIYIDTLEGTHYASTGDWIIRGVHGEHYPCKPDIFEKTYEAVI